VHQVHTQRTAFGRFSPYTYPMGNFFLGVLATLIVLGVWHHFTQAPQAERTWAEEHAYTSYVEGGEGIMTIRNVRDWTYHASGPITKEWVDVTVDPTEVKRVWFVIVPFSKWKAVGHTFLSFEFNDGTTLAFSVEARREADEAYSWFDGMLRRYELTYQWGTERDFIARRLVQQGHPVRMYPLTLPEGAGAALLRTLADETNALAATPRFYNTLVANCTNLLAKAVNQSFPGTLPRHYAWLLTGYSDTYLMREEFIEIVDASEERTKARYDLMPHREAIGYAASLDPLAFSEVVRLNLGMHD